MSNGVWVIGGPLRMATAERKRPALDSTPIGVGAPVAATSTLVDASTLVPVVLDETPTINGKVIAQAIPGALLASGHRYRLVITFTTADPDETSAMALMIHADF